MTLLILEHNLCCINLLIHFQVVVLSRASSKQSIIVYNYIELDGPKADAIVVGIGTGDQEQGSMDSTS